LVNEISLYYDARSKNIKKFYQYFFVKTFKMLGYIYVLRV